MATPISSAALDRSSGGGGTIVQLPPPQRASAATASGSAATAAAPTFASLPPADPYALLESYDRGRRVSVSRKGLSDSAAATATERPALDPVQFLNQHYQTEAALTHHLPALRDAVSKRQQSLDERISMALQRQSETAEATRSNVQAAQAAIQTLSERVHLVQSKAKQSEAAVLHITSDMKMLDGSKRHLQRTITTLKRLHMWVHAVEELRLLAKAQPADFQAASQLVQAIRLLRSHFDTTMSTQKVPPLLKLGQTVQHLQTALQQQVVQGFRRTALGAEQAHRLEYGNDEASGVLGKEDDTSSLAAFTPAVLKGGVHYLDALGLAVRDEFIRDFCQDLLHPYKQDYAPPPPKTATTQSTAAAVSTEKRVSSFMQAAAPAPAPAETAEAEAAVKPYGLDVVEQRFLWFRQVLEDEVQPKFGTIFPLEWHVQASLARAFLQLTKRHFLQLLKIKGNNNATVLLKALQKTLVFEKEITAWLGRECQTEFLDKDATTASKATKPTKPPPASQLEDEEDYEQEDDKKKSTAIEPLMGVASVAFDNFMTPYVALEEQAMNDQLAQALEDRTVDNRGELPVFISSTNLFVYIKGSITRCTALTKGKPFFQLCQAFSEALRKYSSLLNGKLPKATTTLGSSSMAGITMAGLGKAGAAKDSATESYKIPNGEEVTVCHVISTCEYCADTMEALEELIRDTMESEKLKAKLNMMADQESFHELTAKSIRVLVSGLTNRTQEVLNKELMSTNWAQWDNVGEESDYVRMIHKEVQPFCQTAKSLLPVSYFRSFCDKFALAFSALYHDTVVRLKRISEQGTQQLLLDVYNLKTLFLKLPVLEESGSAVGHKKPGSTIAPAMYTKLVHKQFGKIETLLKLVGTPNDLLIDNFKSLGGGTAAELQIVMNLKGIKRPDQVTMLEQFGLDPAKALKGATRGVSSTSLVTERVQAVTADLNLNQMRSRVDDFRKSFR